MKIDERALLFNQKYWNDSRLSAGNEQGKLSVIQFDKTLCLRSIWVSWHWFLSHIFNNIAFARPARAAKSKRKHCASNDSQVSFIQNVCNAFAMLQRINVICSLKFNYNVFMKDLRLSGLQEMFFFRWIWIYTQNSIHISIERTTQAENTLLWRGKKSMNNKRAEMFE